MYVYSIVFKTSLLTFVMRALWIQLNNMIGIKFTGTTFTGSCHVCILYNIQHQSIIFCYESIVDTVEQYSTRLDFVGTTMYVVDVQH